MLHQDNLLQRKRWQVFSLIMALIVLFCLIIIFTLILTKKESVRYVEFSTKDTFRFRVLESSNISQSQKELIILGQLKEYIKSRVTKFGGRKYNKDEFDLRKFNYVKAFSSPPVFDEYFTELTRIHETAQFYKREVKIISAIKQEENKYLFSFNTIDYYEYELNPVINRFSVYLKFQFINSKMITDPILSKLNPLSYQITWYRGDKETNNVNSSTY